MNNILFAFGLTLFAGLSTGIGSAIAFFTKKSNTKFLAVILGFSAGVMIYVSFIEIFQEARSSLISVFGKNPGTWITVLSFFAGMLVMAIVDKILPESKNPHDIHNNKDDLQKKDYSIKKNRLMRTGVFTAIAIAIHNFPEGIAVFISGMQEVTIAIPIAIAIAIHNIPEGVAVSVPIFYATGNRKKAFFYSFLSGLSEPLGALLAYLILMPIITPTILGIIFAAVAGIMVFISFDELLPAARRYGEHHLSIYGLVGGMVVMAVSLILL